MANTLPTNYDTLLCESVRPELGNKLTILGFFAGNDVIVEKDALGKSLPSLCFITRLMDGEGKFEGVWHVLGPSGQNIGPPQNKLDIEKLRDHVNTVLITVNGHPIPEFGTYLFELEMQGRKYPFSYEIKKR